MKITVKRLNGCSFDIEAEPDDLVADVKKNIEKNCRVAVYIAEHLLLVYDGILLEDDTTLKDNNVLHNCSIVVMQRKVNAKSSGASSTTTSTTTVVPPANSVPSSSMNPDSTPPPCRTVMANSDVRRASDTYGQAANLPAGSNIDSTIQNLLEIGGGTWKRDTIVYALRAAYNNPERAIDYLYTGIPTHAIVPPVARTLRSSPAANASVQASHSTQSAVQASQPTQPAVQASQPALPAPLATRLTGPNTTPLNIFPQATSYRGLDLHSAQFRALRALVQANPELLEPMLEELDRQNPSVRQLIQDNQAEFMREIAQPPQRPAGDLSNQSADAIPQEMTVTPEEQEAIARLEAMGFDRMTVLQVFFACNKDETQAANCLLDSNMSNHQD